MAVVLKCYADRLDKDNNAVVVYKSRIPKNTPNPQPGDQAFVWTIELDSPRPGNPHAGAKGKGLEYRGNLVSPVEEIEDLGKSAIRFHLSYLDPSTRPLNKAINTNVVARAHENLSNKLKEAHSGI